VPLDQAPVAVSDWFDAAAAAAIPDYDGSHGTARIAAEAYARRAKAANTRRAYRAGVRAWCAWCDQHGLPCLPARAADVVAFLAAERGQGRSVATVDLRRAAIRYLHFIAGCPVPTAEAQVTEAMAGMHRAAAEAGQLPGKKLAATADILRQILAPIEAALAGLRDRALLLVGFAGALRRAELAAIRVEHLEPCERGLRLTLPHSKGERSGRGVTVALPYGADRALSGPRLAVLAGRGRDHRRRRVPADLDPAARPGRPQHPPAPRRHDGDRCRTVARIIQARAAQAAFDARLLGGHSLKRGALSTGMDRNIHPTRLKQLGRHKTYAVLDAYLELGDPFEGHPLNGVL
jgi:integrase